MGIFWIYIGIAIGGIIMILTAKTKYKFFGVIFCLLWPITIPIYYIIKWFKEGRK
jgi:hypothetical protein